MKCVLRSLAIVLILAAVLGITAGCDDTATYRGDHPALFTESVHSIIGVNAGFFCEITVLETDAYGRQLFACRCQSIITAKESREVLGLLIAQKVEDTKVCYYEDVNVIITEVPAYSEITPTLVQRHFSEEEISSLKAINDWDQPLTEVFVEKAVITRTSDPISWDMRKEAFEKAVSEKYADGFDLFLTSDLNGRIIYFTREITLNKENGDHEGRGYFVMYRANGSMIGYQEVQNFWNYQEELIAFKNQYGWKPV